MKAIARFFCVLLGILSAAGLFVSSAAALTLSSVRRTLSPAFIRSTAEGLDFASIRFPDGFGGFTTIPEQMNQSFEPYGVSVSDEQFNAMCRELSLDDAVRDYFLAFRTWLLDDGPVPRIDLRSTAEAMVSGLAPGSLYFVSDPVAFAMSVLAGYINQRTFDSRLESLKPARELLSAGTLLLVCSFVLTFALLLLAAFRLKLLPALTVGGFAAALSGTAAYFAPTLAAPFKASLLGAAGVPLESTFDIVYIPLMRNLSRAGFSVLIAGGALFVLCGILWAVTTAVRNSRARRRAIEAALSLYGDDRKAARNSGTDSGANAGANAG